MGLHTGTPFVTGDGYVGLDVHVTTNGTYDASGGPLRYIPAASGTTRFDLHLSEGYGLTEASPVVTSTPAMAWLPQL